MAIPLKYNLRNLRVRWIATLMTVLGMALVTAVFASFFAMGIGMERSLGGTGDPRNLIVLRKNGTETQSEISKDQASNVAALEGISKDAEGNALVSAELVVTPTILKEGGGKSNLALRGVGPMATKVRDGINVIEGRWLKPGLSEIVVGKSARSRFADLKVGSTPLIGRKWTVVGVFEADGQAYESEVWGDINEVKEQFKRDYSALIVRCPNAATVDRLGKLVADDKQIQLEGKPHPDYYKEQNMSALMLKAMGVIMGFILSIGGIFGAANTMFAAVSTRSKEIATLRVLGFSRMAIWFSFTLESALIGLLGGLLGSLFAFLAVNGMTTGTANWQTFSEIAFQFRVTPGLMMAATILSIIMGIVGGFLPAFRASRATIAKALRGL